MAGAGRAARAGPGAGEAPPPDPRATPATPRPWADGLPRDLLEAVARAVPEGDRLWFRLVCKSWAAAGTGAAVVPGEEPLPRRKVTRTRGPDPAASAACVAEVMVGAVEEPLRREFWNDLCACSAQRTTLHRAGTWPCCSGRGLTSAP